MANLGNVWHIPANAEPRGRGSMRDPIGAIVPGTAVTIITGNQFQGPGGNPGNQLQDGSTLFFRKSTDANFTPVPLFFNSIAWNNKYYAGIIPAEFLSGLNLADYRLRHEAQLGAGGEYLVVEDDEGIVAGFGVIGRCLDEDLSDAGQVYAIYVDPAS